MTEAQRCDRIKRMNDVNILKMFQGEDANFLSQEQETFLFKNLDCNAREKILNSHIRLVVKLARDYSYYGLDLEDLISEGCVGLFRAIERFDCEKGARFSYYCTFWIKQSITKALADQSRTIRLPTGATTEYLKILKYIKEYKEKSTGQPSNEDISKGVGVSVNRVGYILDATRTSMSIDEPMKDNDSRSVGEIIEDEKNVSPSKSIVWNDNLKLLKKFINKLNNREQYVINYRFGLEAYDEQTLAEIGQKLKITRERVRQIEDGAMKKLKIMFHKEDKIEGL